MRVQTAFYKASKTGSDAYFARIEQNTWGPFINYVTQRGEGGGLPWRQASA